MSFNEKEFIINSYKALLKIIGDRKLAIYGIGNNTKIVLENFDSSNVVGIMDEARTGEVIHGKKVISTSEMVSLGVKAVVIISRASNLKIIYRRIADVCNKNGIEVYDINGNLVVFEEYESKSFEKYESISADVLKDKIGAADVVSFDVFDTLVMRRVLYPRDIFLLIENEIGSNFSKRRINADTELIQSGGHPTIYDIYEYMREFSPDREIELEKSLLVKRSAMCEILDYALEAGKDVYAVSDMYLTGDIIFDMLSELGISIKQENILVSCEHKCSKWTGGLFAVLRERTGDKRILHIGDNYECDIKRALENGIDDAFHLEAASKMLEDSHAEELLKFEGTLVNRLLIGEFISRQLNSPFLFSKTQGKFSIDSNYEMAYSFIAPMLFLFFSWLVAKAKELNLDMILLPSRDGYIIERIYDVFRERDMCLPQMRYFYVSRAATVLAGIVDDEDIVQAGKLEYAGTMRDVLKTRFHLDDDDITQQGDCDNTEYVLRHREAIYRKASEARDNYRKYVKKLNITDGETVGFMDFIAVGNCQRYLKNVLDFKLHGLYFYTYNIDNGDNGIREIVVDSLAEITNCFQFSNNIFEMQFMLEPIIISFEPTLSHFNSNGEPVFFEDYRTQKQLDDLSDIFNGIVDYVKDSKIQIETITAESLPLIDALISFIKPKYSDVHTDYFDNIEMKDPFNNRTFSYCLD